MAVAVLAALRRVMSGGGTASIASDRLMLKLRSGREAEDERMMRMIGTEILPHVARIARVPADRISMNIGRDPASGLTMSIQLPARRGRRHS